MVASKNERTILHTMAEVEIESLKMVVCARVTQQYFLLDQSGRCLGPQTVEIIIELESTSSFFAPFVGGSYMLSEVKTRLYLHSVQGLSPARAVICRSISDLFSSKLKLLELTLEVMLKDGSNPALLVKPAKLENCENVDCGASTESPTTLLPNSKSALEITWKDST
jgi:hypothetical protein